MNHLFLELLINERHKDILNEVRNNHRTKGIR